MALTCNHIRECDGGTLVFVAFYAAPGVGQSWSCTSCNESFAVIGEGIFLASEGAHIPEPEYWR